MMKKLFFILMLFFACWCVDSAFAQTATYIRGNHLVESYTSYPSGTSDVNLTASSTTYQVQSVDADRNYNLPNATTLELGRKFIFINNANSSTSSMTVYDAAANPVAEVGQYDDATCVVTNIGSAGGIWFCSQSNTNFNLAIFNGLLSASHGGTGVNSSGSTGIAHVAGGTWTFSSIVNADVNATAAIADTKLATISTALKVSNSATTAASANTASAIVARDGSGNFSAGTITANLTGNVTGNVTGAVTGNASTATALAANPTDCSANQFANTIAASGNLSCATPDISTADITGVAPIARGGTNNGSLGVAAGGPYYGDGSKIVQGAAGTAGQLITSTGATIAAETVWYVDATLDGANPTLGIGNTSSYTEITDTGLTLKPQSGSVAVGTMCSGTNAATAPSTSNTTCAVGSESIGINFALPANHSSNAGVYQVCFYGSQYIALDSGETVASTFELIETPTNAQTLTLEGGTRLPNRFTGMTISTGTSADVLLPMANCSIFNWTGKSASATVGVRLMFEQLVTGTPNSSVIVMDASANEGQRNGRWTVTRVR